jgi:hypothetical protein
MSDTEAMVRLMEHAVERLKQASILVADRQYDTLDRRSCNVVLASVALARGVLSMVAASVAPENRAAAQALRDGYEKWAEDTDDAVPLNHTEIESVRRFLIGRTP